MVQSTAARLMQATRARMFRPGMQNQWGYVEHRAPKSSKETLKDRLHGLLELLTWIAASYTERTEYRTTKD